MWNQGENRSTFWIFFGVVIIGSTPPITFHNKAAFNRSIIFFLSYSVGRCRLKKIKQIRFSPMTSRPRSAPPTPTGSTVPSPSTPPIQTERRWNFGNYFDYLTHSNKIAFLISLSRWCGIDIETPTVQCFPLNMILICRYLFFYSFHWILLSSQQTTVQSSAEKSEHYDLLPRQKIAAGNQVSTLMALPYLKVNDFLFRLNHLDGV